MVINQNQAAALKADLASAKSTEMFMLKEVIEWQYPWGLPSRVNRIVAAGGRVLSSTASEAVMLDPVLRHPEDPDAFEPWLNTHISVVFLDFDRGMRIEYHDCWKLER